MINEAADIKTSAHSPHRWLPFLAPLVGVAIFSVVLYTLHHTLQDLTWNDVLEPIQRINGYQLVLATIFTALSYLALTNYDRLAIAYIGRSLPLKKIIGVSFTAYAVGNNVGLAALSGGSIRYRAYSPQGFSGIEIATLIGFCTLTFALGSSLLLGVALLIDPGNTLQHANISTFALRGTGVTLILLPLAYLAWGSLSKRIIMIGSWQLKPPGISISCQQIIISVIDLILAASVIYTLLPSETSVTFLAYLSAYLIAMGVAIISSVPGGIGVFEGLMLLQLPNIPKADLLGAMLLFRVIYYAIPLLFALLMLSIQEAAARQHKLKAITAHAEVWIGQAAPQALGAVIFLMGAVLLISGATAELDSRLTVISHYMPLPMVEASHMLNSLTAVALLIVAHGLYRRLNAAYHLTIGLLIAGIIFSLSKGLDYEEALIVGAALLFLWLGRAEFHRSASLLEQRFTPSWIFSIALVIGGSIWLGLFSYRHVEYQSQLWWQFALDDNAPRMLRGSLIAVFTASLFGLLRLLKSTPPAPTDISQQDLTQAGAIARASNRSIGNAVLLADKRILFNQDRTAFIMYQISGGSWIALGDPVGDSADYEALIWQFREVCDCYNARCVFYQVTDQHLPLYVDVGLSLSKLGEEARISLPSFSLIGSHRAELRQVRNRAERERAAFEVIPANQVATVIDELELISNEWLEDKAAHEKGFSLGAFTAEYMVWFDCAVVKIDGIIVAFANLWPAGHDELSIDLMRYSKAAPKGVMDYLFVELMLYGQANGFEWFSLGMAPLAGLEHHQLAPAWHKIGNVIFEHSEHFYHFEGLRSFKKKFDPQWEPRYLAAPGGLATPRVLLDATVLISGGVKQIFTR